MKIIIILAHLMDQKGHLSEESKGRTLIAKDLFFNEKCDYILVPGWNYRKDCRFLICDRIKEFLTSNFDLNPKFIVTLPRSRDTVGDAIFSSIYLDENNINPEKIFIVTSDYHCLRSSEIFKYFHKPNLSISTSYFYKTNFSHRNLAKELDSFEKFKKMFLNVRQNDLLEAKKVLVESHPYYNGDVYPLLSF